MKYLVRMRRQKRITFLVLTLVGIMIIFRENTRYEYEDCIYQQSGLHGKKATEEKQSAEMSKVKHTEPWNTRTPRVVYYLWCGYNPDFGFNNYLSLLSTVKFLQPELIVFLCTEYPRVDQFGYNTWLEEFMDFYPHIMTKNISKSNACQDRYKFKEVLYGYLYEGGLVMGTSTVLSGPATHLWGETYRDLMVDPRAGFIVTAPKVGTENISFRTNPPQVASKPYCDSLQLRDKAEWNTTDICVSLPLELKPRDLWSAHSRLGMMLLWLLYGETSVPSPHPAPHPVIPNIGHMLWLAGRPIDFTFYLSALSFIYVAKVDKLFIHGDREPTQVGYWQKLMEESKIHFIKIVKPEYVYNQRSLNKYHISDIFRAQLMLDYGGIYGDRDVIWTQPISEQLRRYDAVASYDFAHNYPHYPDYINLGVSMGRPGARFWQLFSESFKQLRDDLFGYNGLLQPYKIYERNPHLLHIDHHLQVMCHGGKCFPRWTARWQHMDWRRDTYAVHWVHPNPDEFRDQQTLVNSGTVFAQIGQNVLKMAGKL